MGAGPPGAKEKIPSLRSIEGYMSSSHGSPPIAIMKRSRTCQCLQDLDVPKRSRSTPDLGVLQRAKEVFGREGLVEATQNVHNHTATSGLDRALRFFRPSAASGGLPTASPFYTAGHTQGFVMDSILRSTGSLNEMVILEHEQFIGDERSVDLGRTSSSSSSSSSTGSFGCQSGGDEASVLFGGAVSGTLFDDVGDSSDYFCGVDSDEAEAGDDGPCNMPTLDNTMPASAPNDSTGVSDEAMNETRSEYPVSLGNCNESEGTRAKWGVAPTTVPTPAVTTAPPWCGQRGRYGYLPSAGRPGAVGRVWMNKTGGGGGGGEVAVSPPVIVPEAPSSAYGYDYGDAMKAVKTVRPPWPSAEVRVAAESRFGIASHDNPASFSPSPSSCPPTAGISAAPLALSDASHRHHDPGGGGDRVCGSHDGVVALLNVNLDCLHLENQKRTITRVV